MQFAMGRDLSCTFLLILTGDPNLNKDTKLLYLEETMEIN